MNVSKPKPIHVYTDGSFSSLYRTVAGIGIHFPNGELEDVSETLDVTPTNQRAELFAILRAIQIVREHDKTCDRLIHIFTDSKYAHDSCTVWLPKWKANGWKTVQNKDVMNQDILLPLTSQLQGVRFQHVRAHTGERDAMSIANDVADKLAKRAIKNHYERTRAHTTHHQRYPVPAATL